jgi:hypothetical protein
MQQRVNQAAREVRARHQETRAAQASQSKAMAIADRARNESITLGRRKSYSRGAEVCNRGRSGRVAENATSPGELIYQLIRKWLLVKEL